MIRHRLPIHSVERLNQDVYRIKLVYHALASQGVGFKAGQYLELFLPDGRGAYFSIASAPEVTAFIELHIRSMPESDLNQALLHHLQTQAEIELSMSMGQCHLVAEELAQGQAIYFVAGSTGFAQLKSMIEHLLSRPLNIPMTLFWGGREAGDLYMQDLARSWAVENEHFSFVPVISGFSVEDVAEENSLPHVVANHIDSPANLLVYACGSPGMVYALVDQLESRGVTEKQIHADVFAYAPRPAKS